MLIRNVRILILAAVTLVLAGLAAAQTEPTIKQIYEAAHSGQVEKARQMAQEVLRNHPQSAKAHFVMAELDASQGRASEAKGHLVQAESLAPGLPFARPEAVQALRARLSSSGTLRSQDARNAPAAAAPPVQPDGSSFPWGLLVLAAAAAAGIAWFMRRRTATRAQQATASQAYAPNAFGVPPPGNAWGRDPGPAYSGYGAQPGYGTSGGQPTQSGMGGRVMGGLATGLAVGAGALAAQEIGRRMMGEHGQQASVSGPHSGSGDAAGSSLAQDAGVGSIDGAVAAPALPQDFGIQDPGSWDGGSFDAGGGDGGGWDS